MAAGRGMSTETKETETWGDDIIYSESICQPEDVFYEGSENDDYDNEATRRRRYEEAGQRFLDGTIPVLVSASLRGPFDSRSGFANPWASNRRKTTFRLSTEPAKAIKRNVQRESRTSSHSKVVQKPTLHARTTDCHLPSPESLKQAPYTEQHPYLEADELDKVNKWREKVDPLSNKGDFWGSDRTDNATSLKRRRAAGSEWLKKVSAKRQRSSITQQPSLYNGSVDIDVDELMADTPSSSLEKAAPVNSPSNRRSPRNTLRKATRANQAESDDELSPNKAAAAATLSSPVSLRNAPVLSSSMTTTQPPNYITSSVGTQTTPSRLRYVEVQDIPSKDESLQAEAGPPQTNDNRQYDGDDDADEDVESMSDIGSPAQSVPETTLNEEDDGSQGLPKGHSVGNCTSDTIGVRQLQGVSLEITASENQSIKGDVESTADDNNELDSDMEAGDDSGESTASAQNLLSVDGNEASSAKHANHEGTSFNAALVDSKTAMTDDNVEAGSKSNNHSTPATPTHGRPTRETSQFSFKGIFNRFVPSSPWSKLAHLTASASPCPSTKSPKPHMNDGENQDQQADTVTSDCNATPKENDAVIHQDSEVVPKNEIERHDGLRSQSSCEIPDSGQLIESIQDANTTSASKNETTSPVIATMKDIPRVCDSQQSPWIKTEHAVLSRSPLGILPPNLSEAKSLHIGDFNNGASVFTSQIQSPWAKNTSPVASFVPNAGSKENVEQRLSAKPSITRPTTPEPQFCVKSFSSFISPSPDRSRKGTIALSSSRPCLGNRRGARALRSAMATRFAHKRPDRRVSWADSLVQAEGTSSQEDILSSTQLRPRRRSSPPPETPISDLRADPDTKFAKHFEAVANRNTHQRDNLIPTESQQQQSPNPFAMAETFMAADATDQESESKGAETMECPDSVLSRASEEPMDIVEDMVREMGDFWDPWNVDAELDRARKVAQDETG